MLPVEAKPPLAGSYVSAGAYTYLQHFRCIQSDFLLWVRCSPVRVVDGSRDADLNLTGKPVRRSHERRGQF
jgi:hypothetical protein